MTHGQAYYGAQLIKVVEKFYSEQSKSFANK